MVILASREVWKSSLIIQPFHNFIYTYITILVLKLKKSKFIKILVMAFVGISLFSFIPAIRAESSSGTTIRPIEDFLEANEFVLCNWFGSANEEQTLYLEVHSEYLTGEVIRDCPYDGVVIEKVLNNKWVEFEVLLFVKDAHIYVWHVIDPSVGGVIILEGTMDYTFQLNFRIQQEPGEPIPRFLWGIINRLRMTGQGSGVFTPESLDYGYTPGETAQVTINQIGLNHLAQWPVELLFFH